MKFWRPKNHGTSLNITYDYMLDYCIRRIGLSWKLASSVLYWSSNLLMKMRRVVERRSEEIDDRGEGDSQTTSFVERVLSMAFILHWKSEARLILFSFLLSSLSCPLLFLRLSLKHFLSLPSSLPFSSFCLFSSGRCSLLFFFWALFGLRSFCY